MVWKQASPVQRLTPQASMLQIVSPTDVAPIPPLQRKWKIVVARVLKTCIVTGSLFLEEMKKGVQHTALNNIRNIVNVESGNQERKGI